MAWSRCAALLFCVACIGVEGLSAKGGIRQNGMNFLSGQWSAPAYDSPEGLESLQVLKNQTGLNYVALSFAWYQPTVDTAGPIYRGPKTPTDDALRTVIARAHDLGIKVMLRPLVDPDWRDNATHSTWRGEIGRNFSPAEWTAWFQTYQDMLVHYANLSETFGVDELCVGGELIVASHQESHWRNLVKTVRTLYRGPLMYAANHGNEGDVKWWDAVDVIGIDAYYPLDKADPEPSLAELRSAWSDRAADLASLAHETNRSIVFAEVGYCSSSATNVDPAHCYTAQGPANQTAQVAAYEALLEVMYTEDWFLGVFWWAWNSDLQDGGLDNKGFTVHSKPAAAVLKKWYT